MDENSSEGAYNSVKEMVLDEAKLVTYVSISKDLCLHVNESKRLLGQLIEQLKKSQPNMALNVNYIISGLTKGNHALTTVCSEADIASVRNSLKTVFFEHIYSVRKSASSVDNVAIMSVTKFEDFPLCTGQIKNSICIKHSMEEISNLKSNSQEFAVTDTKVNNIHSKIKEVKKEGSKTANVRTSNNHIKTSDTKEIDIKPEITSPKPDKKVSNKSTKGIAGFFNKSGVATKKSDSGDPSLPLVVKLEKDDKPVITEKHGKPIHEKVQKMEVDKPGPKNPKTSQDSENNTKNKNLNKIKKNAKLDKKRKRVLQVSDSESDDEKDDPFADSTPANNHVLESDDEIPPTPTLSTVKITSGIVNPKKKRKTVDKTYTDEDGYILTKKEEVYESCSDNEMEVETKENIVNQVKLEVSPSKKPKLEVSPSKKQNGTKNGKKKISPPQKGKQSTLMSFFKKV